MTSQSLAPKPSEVIDQLERDARKQIEIIQGACQSFQQWWTQIPYLALQADNVLTRDSALWCVYTRFQWPLRLFGKATPVAYVDCRTGTIIRPSERDVVQLNDRILLSIPTEQFDPEPVIARLKKMASTRRTDERKDALRNRLVDRYFPDAPDNPPAPAPAETYLHLVTTT
jgi:hypothetical protein